MSISKDSCVHWKKVKVAKIKFTKGELKKQRDALGQFRHYLPTLQLKKQQLQMKISEARNEIKVIDESLEVILRNIEQWSGLLGDVSVDIKSFIIPTEIKTGEVNIAGATVPIFESIFFKETDYDLYDAPLWVDAGIEKLREMVQSMVKIDVINQRIDVLAQEMRVTTQRVNLFEKIKIPECIDNIRRIRIYLGDQQANAVGIGKVAKGKIEARDSEEILA